jgi:hypothetical protein
MSKKQWPPPGFPIVEGRQALTDTWSIYLPDKFARRIEDSCLVLWRPGLTIWLAAWGNDKGETQSERLKSIKTDASPHRFAETETNVNNLTRYVHRLRDRNEDGPVESLCAYILNDDGHLQMAVYFDDVRDEAKARDLAESVMDVR